MGAHEGSGNDLVGVWVGGRRGGFLDVFCEDASVLEVSDFLSEAWNVWKSVG